MRQGDHIGLYETLHAVAKTACALLLDGPLIERMQRYHGPRFPFFKELSLAPSERLAAEGSLSVHSSNYEGDREQKKNGAFHAIGRLGAYCRLISSPAERRRLFP